MRITTPTEVRTRGDDRDEQGAMWSYVPMEQRIPTDHPLRAMRCLVDGVLRDLSPRFTDLYSASVNHRSRPKRSCALNCCRCCTRSAASAC
jgi:hypothetical protein